MSALLGTSPAGATTQTVTVANWPQYHLTYRHTGYNPNETILSPSTVGGLHQIWKFTTGSLVDFSSAAVVNGVLYMGSVDHHLYALDATTGSELWSYDAGDVIGSAPAYANGVIYFMTTGLVTGTVFALNAATGAFLWSAATTGGAAPPTVQGTRVYQATHTGIYAYDAATGAVAWHVLPDFVSNSGATSSGSTLYVATGKTVGAIKATTGTVIWKKTFQPAVFNVSTPTLAGGVLYIGDSHSGTLYAIDAATGILKWKTINEGGNFDSSPAVMGSVVYVGNYIGDQMWAFDNATGSELWHSAGGGGLGGISAANGVVYGGSADFNGGFNSGSVYAYDATTGANLWTSPPTGGSVNTTPVVVNGMVYVGSDDDSIYAFGL